MLEVSLKFSHFFIVCAITCGITLTSQSFPKLLLGGIVLNSIKRNSVKLLLFSLCPQDEIVTKWEIFIFFSNHVEHTTLMQRQ